MPTVMMPIEKSYPSAFPPLTVFVGDNTQFDCELVTKSLARDHLEVIGWATTSDDVIEGVKQRKPNVALISSRLQDGALAGIRTVCELKQGKARTRIVILLDGKDPNLAVNAFRSGAAGVYYRSSGRSMLRKCIRSVNAGQLWASHEDAAFLIEALRSVPRGSICNTQGILLLTAREKEVVSLVCNGLTNREIANELGLSEHTVKNYMFDIFERVGVSTRVELVLCARQHNQATEPGRINGRDHLTKPATCLSYGSGAVQKGFCSPTHSTDVKELLCDHVA